jgi:hypothetical protein
MDVIALAFILVIAMLSIAIFIIQRKNRRARKRDQYVYRPSNMNSSSINEIIDQAKEDEMKERSSDGVTVVPNSAATRIGIDMKRVNVGRIYGYNEDIFWDEEEYDQFNTECRINGQLPQEVFAAKMRLIENATKIKLLLDEMIEIENSFNKSKSENVSSLELIRSVISRIYM